MQHDKVEGLKCVEDELEALKRVEAIWAKYIADAAAAHACLDKVMNDRVQSVAMGFETIDLQNERVVKKSCCSIL